MDFLTYMQKKAVGNNKGITGPGTPGYEAAQLGSLSQMPDAPAPFVQPPNAGASSGGFLSGLPGVPEEGLGWGILDVLSRGGYATSNMFQEGIRDVRAGDESLQNGEELGFLNTLKAMAAGVDEPGQAWQGFSGQQKITGSDIVEDALGDSADEKGGFGKGAASFAIDIFGDPTSYIGLGLIKSGVKGAETAVEAAAKSTDEMAQTLTATAVESGKAPKALGDGGRAAAIARRMSPEGVYDVKGSIPMGVGSRATAEGVERVDGAIPIGTRTPSYTQGELFTPNRVDVAAPVAKAPDEVVDDAVRNQLDLFTQPPVVPKAKPTPVPKESPTPRLTTSDVPSMAAVFGRPAIQSVDDAVRDIPLPVGADLGADVAPYAAKGSTAKYAQPGQTSSVIAREALANGERYINAHKATRGKPDDLVKAYRNNEQVRPFIDTPAERAFMDTYTVTAFEGGGRQASRVPITELDYFAVPKAQRAAMTNSQDLVNVLAKGPKGKINKRVDVQSDELFRALHGEPVEGLDPKALFIRGADGKVQSVADIAARQKRAVADPAFWAQGRKNAERYINDPKAYEARIYKQNRQHLEEANGVVDENFKVWQEVTKEFYPQLTDATLKAVHDAAAQVIDAAWDRTVVKGRSSVEEFMRAQVVSTEVRSAMVTAIATKGTPEELLSDLAHIKGNYDTMSLNIDLSKILSSAAPAEAKAVAAETAQESLQQIDEVVTAADEAIPAAKAQRAEKAQAASSNTAVAEKSREAANYNDIKPRAQEVIDGSSWGTSLSKDQAIGITRGAVGAMLKIMMKPKNYASYHQMNQANMLNKILGEIGTAGKGEWKSVIMRRGNAKSAKDARVVELSRRVANLMKATENQMDEAAGFMPNAWNGGSKSGKGWTVGTPGVTQVAKSADRSNVPFSSSHLMDDMIEADFKAVAEGGKSSNLLPSAIFGSAAEKQSALWTKVVNAALFKDAPSLKAIPDPVLRKWLLNYDPAENIAMATERNTGKVSQYVKAQSTAAEKHVADAKVNDSAARASKVESETDNVAKETIQRDPAAPVESADDIADATKAAGDELADAIDGPAGPVGKAMEVYKAPLGVVAKRGPANMPKANNASRNTTKAAGSKAATPGKAIEEEAFDAPWNLKFKQVFQTHAGAETLRPLMQHSFDYVKASIAQSARTWDRYGRELRKATNKNPQAALMSIKSLDPNSAYTAAAGTEDLIRGMRKRMEDLMGGTDLSRFVAGNTSVTKGAVPRDAINTWLKAHGSKFEFEDGDNWMAQWEKSVADAKTPEEAIHILHGIENAVKNASIERFFYDDLAVRFGNQGGGYTVNHPYLSGVQFPKEMAMEVKRVGELIDQIQKPLGSNGLMRAYDQALRVWKTGMTIYNPAHHVRNFTGDYWLLMADGGGFTDYMQSVRMLNKYRGTTYDVDAGIKMSNKLKDIDDPAKLLEAMMAPRNLSAKGQTFKNKATKHVFDEDQIMAAAKGHGMFQSAGQLEDIVEAGTESLLGKRLGGAISKQNRAGMSVTKPFAGNIHRGASIVSETRDHSVRLAHFIHGVKNSAVKKTAGMSDAQYQKLVYEDAARRSRTHHPDGLDLSQWERKYARRMIPFYSWQRKSIPLILQTAWKRPGLVTAYPKAQAAWSYGATGESGEGYGSLPGDQMFPSWISENPWAVIGGSAGGAAGGEGYDIAKGPSVPSADLLPMINNPASFLGQITPAIRTPAELAFGKEIATGIPVDNPAELVAKQIPGVSKVISWEGNKAPIEDDLLNWIAAIGKLKSGEYIDSAMYEQQMKERGGG